MTPSKRSITSGSAATSTSSSSSATTTSSSTTSSTTTTSATSSASSALQTSSSLMPSTSSKPKSSNTDVRAVVSSATSISPTSSSSLNPLAISNLAISDVAMMSTASSSSACSPANTCANIDEYEDDLISRLWSRNQLIFIEDLLLHIGYSGVLSLLKVSKKMNAIITSLAPKGMNVWQRLLQLKRQKCANFDRVAKLTLDDEPLDEGYWAYRFFMATESKKMLCSFDHRAVMVEKDIKVYSILCHDGRIICGTRNGDIWMFRINAQDQRVEDERILEGHRHSVMHLTASGDILASKGIDCIRLWSLSELICLQELTFEASSFPIVLYGNIIVHLSTHRRNDAGVKATTWHGPFQKGRMLQCNKVELNSRNEHRQTLQIRGNRLMLLLAVNDKDIIRLFRVNKESLSPPVDLDCTDCLKQSEESPRYTSLHVELDFVHNLVAINKHNSQLILLQMDPNNGRINLLKRLHNIRGGYHLHTLYLYTSPTTSIDGVRCWTQPWDLRELLASSEIDCHPVQLEPWMRGFLIEVPFQTFITPLGIVHTWRQKVYISKRY